MCVCVHVYELADRWNTCVVLKVHHWSTISPPLTSGKTSKLIPLPLS